MPSHNANARLATPRRRDRTMDTPWIRDFLARAPFGVIATADGSQPYAIPLSFVFDESAHAIYLHKAKTGRMLTNIATNNRVCFSVAEMGRLLPGDRGCEFSVEYASVVVSGRASVVTDPAEAGRALQGLLNKYFPHLHADRDYRSISPSERDATAVVRIDIEHWTGKAHRAAPDHPGASR